MHKKPEIICFAGPNGSGKSTLTSALFPYIQGKYINADNIKQSTFCSDIEAAKTAESLREECIRKRDDFTFETVLSTTRNIDLLKKAKAAGYFIRCIFVLTSNPEINVERVIFRTKEGGHDVPKEKIISRYFKSLDLIKELLPICDRLNIYDNTDMEPIRIYKKRGDDEFFYESSKWPKELILNLIGKAESNL